MLTPLLERYLAANPSAVIFALNVDDSPGTAARFDVRSIPTLLRFQDGVLQSRQVGVPNKPALDAFLRGES